MKKNIPAIVPVITLLFYCCTYGTELNRSLESAGSNRAELEAVLSHYRTADPNPYKLRAAEYLIENLPAHYSYAGTKIYDYYGYAARILADTALTPEQQRDSLLAITDSNYSDLPLHTIPDAEIITADYLINNIERSYGRWTTCPWSGHITFDEYLEWLLPYKAVELQELDSWRDTLLAHFGYGLNHPIKNDVEYNTTAGVADMLRNEAQTKMQRYGLYTRAGLPLLSAHLLPRQTFGNIPDYALIAVLLMRSAGIPAVLDETPVGSRYTAATRWFVILSDRGMEETSEWDLSTMIGGGFFPYERGPKVYRNSYAINKERQRYMERSRYRYPFELGKKDVTKQYFLTSDLQLPIDRAYDGNLLSNFEINQPGGNWIGMDMGEPAVVTSVMVMPRSYDNDVYPRNEYELLYWNGNRWKSACYQKATENVLKYDIPINCPLWLRNYTRGRDERPFIIEDSGEFDW